MAVELLVQRQRTARRTRGRGPRRRARPRQPPHGMARSWLQRLPPECVATSPGQDSSRLKCTCELETSTPRSWTSMPASRMRGSKRRMGPLPRTVHQGMRAVLEGGHRGGRAHVRGGPRSRVDRAAEDAHAPQPRLSSARHAPVGGRRRPPSRPPTPSPTSASPAEQIRAKALRAHAAYYRGDFRAARAALPALELAGTPPPSGPPYSTPADSWNWGSPTTPRPWSSSSRLARSPSASATPCTADMVADNIGLLKGAQGHVDEGLAIVRKTMEGTAFARRADLCGLLRSATRPRSCVAPAISSRRSRPCTEGRRERDLRERPVHRPQLAGESPVPPGAARRQRTRSELLAVSRRASGAGLSFVALKAQLYAAIVAQTTGDGELGAELLRDCVPRQLELGHIHLLAQELCPRPAVAALALASCATPDLDAAP